MNTATVDQTKTPPETAGAQPNRGLVSLQAAGGKVMAIIPTNMDQVWRLAKAIALAGWAPKHYKRQDGTFEEEKIAVAIMHGMEVGFTPIAALQSIAVINGMPSIYGDGALALVLASGLMEDYKETRILDQSGKVVGYAFWAKRRGKATPIEQKFEHADAVRAKLIGKAGPWTEYETRMYQMRARGWGLRDGFSDVLKGLSIAEEAMDVVEVVHTAQPGAEQPRRGPAALSAALGVDSQQHPAQLRGDKPDKTKPDGTVEQRDTFVKKLGECKDIEILDLVKDESRGFQWTDADQAVIDEAYQKRLKDLGG